MAIHQISVFLENRAGQLAEITALLAKNNIDLRAINIAETSDYGVLRQKTSAFVRQFHTDPSGVMDEIQASGKLSPEQVQTILNAWNAFAGGDAHAIH